MTFKEFLLQLEGSEKSGNKRPSPQRRITPSMGLAVKPPMPAKSIPDDPIQPKFKPIRAGNELYLIPKPNPKTLSIKRPSIL
jgi:hypothetical protein